ncbi:MAG TPA: aminoglycoside phosphotransferase family protein [Acidimicrobiales bacterium]|nr:aminoglycoside phosphotransferase family protein [Acidimicrobiales bacterium]
MSSFALARARRALQTARLDVDMVLERASSVTNDVFLSDEYVIRVNRRLDPRLAREAALAPHLPPEVRCPPIVAYGGGPHGADWLIVERVPGIVLARAWPTMTDDQRREAIRQQAGILRALHTTPVPDDLIEIEATVPQLLSSRTFYPVMPLLVALDRLRLEAHVDHDLVDRVEQIVVETADSLVPFDSATLIHGDLTFENVMWDGEQITALLDFEWARPGPADLDLDVLLRFCAHPYLHVAPDYEHLARPETYESVPWWLAEDYPALFQFPRQLERMRLYSIAFDVRDLLLTPPDRPPRELSPDHAHHRLRRAVDGTSYLNALAGDEPAPVGVVTADDHLLD